MEQWLGNEGYLQRVFVKIWDLLILNLCYLAACVPVFTIGAAKSALFAVNLKAVRREEGRVFVDFWRGFRDNFRQGTRLWLMDAAAGLVFAVDLWALSTLDGVAAQVLKVLVGTLLAVYLALQPWIFSYNARFADNTKTVLKNALLLCLGNLPASGAMLLVSGLAVFFSLLSLRAFLRALFLWLVLGFSLLNLIQSWLLRRAFDRI